MQTARPPLGKPLGGGGGQGKVFDLPELPGFVYKAYHTPIAGAAQSLAELVLTGERLAPELARKRITATWPTRVCAAEDVVDGYVMRRIPPRFRIELQTPYGIEFQDATLDLALAPNGRTIFPKSPVMTDDRIELLRLVAEFLHTLHRNDQVYGDLSLRNLMFSRTPNELLVMDMDGVRHIATRLNRKKDLVHTPDWKDPMSHDQIPLGFDLDRYKFALLVYRLLVADSVSAPLPKDADSIVVTNVDDGSDGRLTFLLRRAAASGVGGRPPVNEWLAALNECRAAR